MSLLTTYRLIASHPLTRHRKLPSLLHWLRWQVGSRLLGGAAAVPFVDQTRLLARRGMTGATGNIYCGLHEFADMGFVLHFLRPGDLFVDVGANIGSYSLLAAAAGARVICFEPVPSTYELLLDNIHLNRLQSRVTAQMKAVGSQRGTLTMMADQDTTNQVLRSGASYAGSSVEVEQVTLDDALGDDVPGLIKIDVEGFESEVLAGGKRLLANPLVRAVIMELNGSGIPYGSEDRDLVAAMASFGFTPCHYDPLGRRLTPIAGRSETSANTLFVRSAADAQSLVTTSRTYKVQGCSI